MLKSQNACTCHKNGRTTAPCATPTFRASGSRPPLGPSHSPLRPAPAHGATTRHRTPPPPRPPRTAGPSRGPKWLTASTSSSSWAEKPYQPEPTSPPRPTLENTGAGTAASRPSPNHRTISITHRHGPDPQTTTRTVTIRQALGAMARHETSNLPLSGMNAMGKLVRMSCTRVEPFHDPAGDTPETRGATRYLGVMISFTGPFEQRRATARRISEFESRLKLAARDFGLCRELVTAIFTSRLRYPRLTVLMRSKNTDRERLFTGRVALRTLGLHLPTRDPFACHCIGAVVVSPTALSGVARLHRPGNSRHYSKPTHRSQHPGIHPQSRASGCLDDPNEPSRGHRPPRQRLRLTRVAAPTHLGPPRHHCPSPSALPPRPSSG